MPILYNCRHSGDQYRITKFDSHFNVESSYLCDLDACECPAGHRPHCRHREMLPKFIQRKHVGDEWMYDHDRGGWVQTEMPGDVAMDKLVTEEDLAIMRDGIERDEMIALTGAALPLQLEEHYGTGPAILALPEIHAANAKVAEENKARELAPKPPQIRRRV